MTVQTQTANGKNKKNAIHKVRVKKTININVNVILKSQRD